MSDAPAAAPAALAGARASPAGSGMAAPGFGRLVQAVQANCDISDARHARDMTLCNYLLDMREFYRWECGKPFAETLARADVGQWIARREALWETLADADFMPLPVMGRDVEPFAAAAVNAALAPAGLVYGAGIGPFGKPQFFLGELGHDERRGQVRVLVSRREFARDLSPPPAALQGDTVYLRHESLQRWLWGKVETWGVKKPDGAWQRALAAYGFDADPRLAVERMAEAEAETLIMHELGEFAAGQLLGGQWQEMRAGFTGRRAEIVARAVRDNLADCLVTLPALMDRNATASIHFWFANFDGMRRELFPLLAGAYAKLIDGDDGHALESAITAGQRHWRDAARRLLDLFLAGGAGEPAAAGLAEMAETRL